MQHKSKTIQLEMQKGAEKLNAQDSFVERNYGMYVVIVFFVLPLAAIVSAVTTGAHLYVRWEQTLHYPVLTWMIVGIVAIMLEISKALIKLAIDDLQASIFSKAAHQVALFFLKAIWGLGALVLGVFLSVSGADKITNVLRDNQEKSQVAYLNVDSIQTAFDAKLAFHQGNIATYKKQTWAGKLTPKAEKLIAQEQASIDKLETQRENELGIARTENLELETKYELETASGAGYAQGLMGFAELIYLACLVFWGLYDQGLKKEVEAATTAPSASTPPPHHKPGPNPVGFQQIPSSQAGPLSNETPTPRYPIGFRYGQAQELPQSREPDTLLQQVATPVETQNEATEADYSEFEAEVLQGFLKNANSQLKAWENKLRIHHGLPETNERHIKKWQQTIAAIKKRLADLGETV